MELGWQDRILPAVAGSKIGLFEPVMHQNKLSTEVVKRRFFSFNRFYRSGSSKIFNWPATVIVPVV